MARQETDPDRVHVYLIEEMSDDPDIPAQKAFRKIGILQESLVNSDIFHGRLRALRQGNVRHLEVVFSILLPNRQRALKLESNIHKYLLKKGIESRIDESCLAGHGEWFRISQDDAIEAMKLVSSETIYEPDILVHDLFDLVHPRHYQRGGSDYKVKLNHPISYKIHHSGLFE